MSIERSPEPEGPTSALLGSTIADVVDRELKAFLDHAAEGLHWVGPDGTILWANQTELDLLGYPREEYIGHNITEFHVDRPVIDDMLARLIRGETLLNWEARLRCKDGSIRFVQINSNVLWRDDRFLHTRCFTRDITDRKAVDELARRLADIVENSDDAIIGQDLDGQITSWNLAAERMYGHPAAEAIGQSIRLILPSGREPEEAGVVLRVRNGERVPPFETVRKHRSGRPIHIALAVSPIRNREGHVVGASKSSRDIGARRRLEARDRFLVELDDHVRSMTDPEEITFTAARALGEHLGVNRCAYAFVEEDQDTFLLTGNYHNGVGSIVGRYTFRQFGEACLRLMRAGEPYVVADVDNDPRITESEKPSYEMTAICAVICVPILKQGRFVAAMAVHSATPRAWEPDEVELLQRVAGRCWESIERARVTRELRQSEQLFRALANSIANLAWMARPDGWIYWYNDQWYAYTGTTPGDMEGWGWERVHDPAILPAVRQQWQQSIASGTPFEMVFPLRGADGQFRRFLTRVNPVRNSRGHVVQWVGTNTDVEDERRTTEANVELQRRERLAREEAELQKRLLHSLFMQAPTLIAVLRGPEHRIELANPRIREAWGRTETEVINRPLLDVLPEFRDQVFPSLLDEAYRSGMPCVGKETAASFQRTDGTLDTAYFDFVYSPFRGVDGEIEGIFAIASDVTEQVLARNQVNQLREAAEAANRAKDEFLAMLGHELRNPLSPILTALQLMRLRGIVGGERERTVIERQVTHLTRLVDDLLDVSRIARGKIQLKEELVELADVVAKAVEMTSPLFEQRAHTLELDVPRGGLPARGDATRLSQVISNLLTNAAKYTPAGGHITVRATEEQEQVVLRVRDTGIGIAPDVLPHVFDLFVQGRQALDRSQGGLGLGLTIVRNLVEQHGGSVSASSQGRGAGSEFVVRLPKATVGAVSQGLHAAHAEAGIATTTTAGGPRVLVVDDNVDAAEMLAAALTAKGYETMVAHSGPAALLAAETFRPAIGFLDLGLPVMDGYELATRLRDLSDLPSMRLVAVTGYGQKSDRRKTRQAGFHHHLVKPVDLRAVDEVLTRLAAENAGLDERESPK
jgi:PAS domain S-box-containing protein